MRKIAIANKKGGVGKTTSALNIGAGLQKLGKKVLLIDLDSQANLTTGLGFQKHTQQKSLYEVLRQEIGIEETILNRDGLFLVPSSKRLQGADKEFLSEPDWQFFLAEALEALEDDRFDYVLMDCPPHIGFLTYNAINAANEVYIPVQTEYFSLEGLNDLMEAIGQIKKRSNPDVIVSGVFATRHGNHKLLNRDVLDVIKERFGKTVFETFIRENLSISEAQSHGKTIFEYQPNSNGARDYMNLCHEIINQV